eukprot:Lithocolla_globosa_v1_NODE_1678_length_2402_cov_33.350660.p1 type:complete len:398 gc:universal NODE_1678_length_2402_cov_33.350660:1481-288(-)
MRKGLFFVAVALFAFFYREETTTFWHPYGEVVQLGYVVKNATDAISKWSELGIGPWFLIRNGTFDKFRHFGNNTSPHILFYLTYSGNTQIEIIQQLNPEEPSPFSDFLNSQQVGLHHVSSWPTHEKFKTASSLLEKEKLEKWGDGNLMSYVDFVYFDGRTTSLNCALEMSTPGKMKGFYWVMTQYANTWRQQQDAEKIWDLSSFESYIGLGFQFLNYLMSPQVAPSYSVSHWGFVAFDLDRSVAEWVTFLGVGPWVLVHEGPLEIHPAEENKALSFRVAMAMTGDHMVEIWQPLDDTPSSLLTWLNRHGEGLHHIASVTQQKSRPEHLTFVETLEGFQEEFLEGLTLDIWNGTQNVDHMVAAWTVPDVGAYRQFATSLQNKANTWDGAQPFLLRQVQ